MTAEEFRNTIKNESYIGGGSPLHLEFHAFSQRAMKLTCEMNYNYHTPEELRSLMSKLTQSEIDETFGIFPPFIRTVELISTSEKMCLLTVGVSFRIREVFLSMMVP